MAVETETKARILIVDDESSIRGLLTSILEEKYSCEGAESAEAALALLAIEPFDLVISDINMPGMSGIDLVARMRESDPDTVVLMISGNQTIDSPIGAIRTGAFDYLRKPFEIQQVEMAVDRAVTHAALIASKRKHEDHLERLVAERTERLNFIAYNDALTGLPNRAFFEEEIARRILECPPDGRLSIFLISLDRFKVLRDTLGNTLGTLLLREVADRLKSLQADGAALARFEGDEFAIVSDCPSATETEDQAKRILELFRSPFALGEYETFVSPSIGIGSFPDDASEPGDLLKMVGSALAQVRKNGGNNYLLYTSDLHENALQRLALENDIRKALVRDEFELYYQPKVDTNSGQVAGMEALIRWNVPEQGVVSPIEFIPAAEETGLIVPMGEWILRTACAQARKWYDEGFRLHLAVNLSPCQFQQSDLVQMITGIVKETGLPPEYLNLEVTESSIMNDTDAAVAMLRELRESGIRISIDDFGTGHSSLGYLKHLPIDVLKIDKSFISDVIDNQDDAALVMAIITLAHTLRLKVVAEGVETEEQLKLLHLLRCDEWQGFLFSRPVPAVEFRKLLTN